MDTEKENETEENKDEEVEREDVSNVDNISNLGYESEDISEAAEWQEETSTAVPEVHEEAEPVVITTKSITSNKPAKKDEKLPDSKHAKTEDFKPNENTSKHKPKGNQKEENVNGKKKIREGKPFTKVVIRRLPHTMTKEVFLDQVSPLPSHDYFYFVSANMSSLGSFSRAYINFHNQNDLFDFTRTFDNYVFIDSKGHEYPAIVEFAPYQRVPKARPGKKKDTLMGTLESDPIYLTFKEQLQAEALENSRTTNKQHYFETEINESEEVVTTPLLEFLKARRAEKDRIREERREDRKRKEVERKLLKQKTKDKPSQEEEIEIKVLQPPKDKKDFAKEKDSKRLKHKDKDDRFVKPENRTREFKNKGGKSYREERLKQAEKREEKKKKETEEVKEIKDEAIIEEEIKDEEKYWNDKKKWKYGGSGDSKGGRTFSRRRDEKKKEAFERKRGSGKPYRTRKGSGESLDDSQKKDKTENNTPEVLEKISAQVVDKVETKESPKSPKKDRSTSSSNQQESNNKKDSSSNTAQKPSKDKAENYTKEKESESSSKENKKAEKDNSSEVSKKNRLQKESSIDSEEGGGKTSKDPRAERRIRNKDRPSIEIYRPGMGKFSRQRLEKERALGSTDESPSHSPSPTPNNNNNKANLN